MRLQLHHVRGPVAHLERGEGAHPEGVPAGHEDGQGRYLRQRDHRRSQQESVDISFYFHGSVDCHRNCETENFVSGRAYFEHSYERTFIEIHMNKIRGSHDTQSGEVTFNNGVRAPFNNEVLRDAFVGTIV